MGQNASFIWHKDHSVGDVDVIIVPGGFSYGDALRSGAIARFSPIMKDVVRFVKNGGPVLGICNGFQILCESGLLPGALMHNASLRFVCKNIHVRIENANTPFTNGLQKGGVLRLPIAHGEGSYIADEDVLDRLEDEDRIAFRYCDEAGNVTPECNPNGSVRNIAGIVNHERNVLGMMPHPERCAEDVLGRPDGIGIFESLLASAGVPV